jgi:hypothetical protein
MVYLGWSVSTERQTIRLVFPSSTWDSAKA